MFKIKDRAFEWDDNRLIFGYNNGAILAANEKELIECKYYIFYSLKSARFFFEIFKKQFPKTSLTSKIYYENSNS